MIDYLYSQSLALSSNHAVAYIYLDYADKEHQKPIKILASLLKQLGNQGSFKEINELYEEFRLKEERPLAGQLRSALITASKFFKRTFIVFDALDECDQGNQRKELLPLFLDLAKEGINVFFTSRPHPEDLQVFLDANAVNKMKIAAQDDDIELYIQQMIDDNPCAKRLVEKGNCRDDIISALKSCAKGMYVIQAECGLRPPKCSEEMKVWAVLR